MNQNINPAIAAHESQSFSSSFRSQTKFLGIALIDANALTQESFIRAALICQSGLVIMPFTSVDECADYSGALDLIVYVYHGLKNQDFEDLSRKRNHLPSRKIVILSHRETDDLSQRSFRFNARFAKVLHASDKSLQAIVSMLFQFHYEESEMATSVLASNESPEGSRHVAESPAMSEFTRREKQILDLVGAGRTNVEISGYLLISINTVKTYLHKIMQKTGTSNRVQLIFAARNGYRPNDAA